MLSRGPAATWASCGSIVRSPTTLRWHSEVMMAVWLGSARGARAMGIGASEDSRVKHGRPVGSVVGHGGEGAVGLVEGKRLGGHADRNGRGQREELLAVGPGVGR